jgi:peroxiredoxin
MGQGQGAAAPGSGTAAPDFTARDVDGKTFRLSDHLAMYASKKDKGLLVLGVAMDGPESAAEVPAFVKRHEVGFPVVLDDDSRIASLYDPKKSMPFSVLIGRDGHIVAVREGYNPGDEKLVEADVSKALGE